MTGRPAPGAAVSSYRTQFLAIHLAICLIGLLLAVALFVLDPIKYTLISAVGSGEDLRTAALAGLRQYSDRAFPLVAGIIVSALALLTLEVRHAALSRALVEVRTGYFLLLTCTLLVWFSQAYLYPGHLIAGDSGSHIVRAAHFGQGLKEGKWLFWDNDFYMGAPFLQFYAPLFFWLSGVLFALLDSIDWAVKLLLMLCSVGGGLLFFAFLRQAGLQRVAALIGALGYTGAWAHGHLILYKGTLPLALIFALMPPAFLCAERLFSGKRLFGVEWVGLALSSAGLIATHQPHGMFAGLYLGAYVVIRSFSSDRPLQSVGAIASAGLAGVLMTLSTVVPFLAEKTWVVASTESSFFNMRFPDIVELGQLLMWSNTETSRGPASAAYLGISIVLLGCIAFYRLFRSDDGIRAWGLLMVALLLLSLVWRGELVRDVIFTVFFVSALAGVGVQLLVDRYPDALRLPLYLLLFVLLDLGSIAVQPLARTDKAYLDTAGQYLASAKPAQRVVFTDTRSSHTMLNVATGPGGDPPGYFPVQTVFGPHNHAATHVHDYSMAMLMRAQQDLRSRGELSALSEAMLVMLNVGRIVNDTGHAMGLPQGIHDTIEEPPLGRVLKIEGTPAIFSSRIVTIDPPEALGRNLLWRADFETPHEAAERTQEFVEDVFALMEFEPGAGIAGRIPVRQAQGEYPALPIPKTASNSGSEPKISIANYSVAHDEVLLDVTSSQAGFLQLSHPWYPTLEVFRNDTRIVPLQGTFNLIVVPVQTGENSYRIIPRRSRLRTALGWLGAATLLFAFLVPLMTRNISESRLTRALK